MLLSRVADSLYWIGRYLERAEQLARLIDVRLDLGLDRRGDRWDFRRLYAMTQIDIPADDLPQHPGALVDVLMFGQTTRDSVMECVQSARDNARQVREEIGAALGEDLRGSGSLARSPDR